MLEELTLRVEELRVAAWVFSPRLPVPVLLETLRVELELLPLETLLVVELVLLGRS